MKVIQLNFAAQRKGGQLFTQVSGQTVCLNCTGPVKRTYESQEGQPVTVTIQPATQEQLRQLYNEKHPLLVEVEIADEPKARVSEAAPTQHVKG